MDGIVKNKPYILKRISAKISPGSIILLHDNRNGAAQLLEDLLSVGKQKGYTFGIDNHIRT